MTGFLDIAVREKSITVGKAAVTVSALSLGDIADLAMRFKPFRDLITRNPAFDMAELLKLGRPVIGGLIAASVGHGGEAEYEAKGAKLAAGEQGVILLALYDCTFPEEVRGPFVEEFGRLFNIKLGLEASAPVQEQSPKAPPAKS